MKNLLLALIAALSLSGCYTSKYHSFGEVPKRPGHYPQPVVDDYLAGTLDESRAVYDVTAYNIDLILDPARKSLHGEVTIYFKALEDIGLIRFDLYENLDIFSVKYSGKDLPYKRFKRAVYASFPDSLEKEQSYSIVIEYGGKPQVARKPPWVGGMVWKKDKDGNPWVGLTCETEGGSIWFPCKDHLSDEPDSVRFRMTVPEGLQVVSNGIMEKHETMPGKEIYTWSTHYPVNIYNITFYAGIFAHITDTLNTSEGVLDLNYYVLPENLEKARDHFFQVKDVLSFYSKTFGPYPWIKEGFGLVEAPYEGMEHQTAIAYGSGYYNSNFLGGDYIIVHEAAHEWWGNAVSVSDFSDIWLQEGFATYSEILFAEHKLGYEKSLFYARNMIASGINNKFPVVGPENVNYWDYKDNDVYHKGAMILHTIRNVINNDSLFFNIIQTFYRDHAAGKHVASSDFIDLVEQKTGSKWKTFFDTYLYSTDVPLLYWYAGYYEESEDDSSYVIRSNAPFIVAYWLIPENFTMPVTFSGPVSGKSETFEITAVPKLFYLKEILIDDDINCNDKVSYFLGKIGTGVLYEYELLESEKKQ